MYTYLVYKCFEESGFAQELPGKPSISYEDTKKVIDTVKKALKSDAVKTLTGEDGPIILAKKAGLNRKEIRRQMEYGLCGLCSYLFSEGIVKNIATPLKANRTQQG